MDSISKETSDYDANNSSDRTRCEEGIQDCSRPHSAELQAPDDTPAISDSVRMGNDGELASYGDANQNPGGFQGELFSTQLIRSGPLPDPAELAGFERTLPGCADRIVTMAEQAQSAAIAQNTRMVNAEASSLKFAAYAASALPYALMTLTGILAYIGKR